jgi:predicted nucleotide-binding protein (sugar kinase/HSP70/actin superfamily)
MTIGLNGATKTIHQIVNDFDNLPIDEGLVKPKVGVVGEILVKFHPTANNNIVELLEAEGAEAVCLQPFACLPNHITGKGMFREIRRSYPQANLTPIDYDPGASEVNQLNRIKLMLSVAEENLD